MSGADVTERTAVGDIKIVMSVALQIDRHHQIHVNRAVHLDAAGRKLPTDSLNSGARIATHAPQRPVASPILCTLVVLDLALLEPSVGVPHAGDPPKARQWDHELGAFGH